MHFICTIKDEDALPYSNADRKRMKELTRENVLTHTFMARDMLSIYLVIHCDDAFAANEIVQTIPCLKDKVVSIDELIWNE